MNRGSQARQSDWHALMRRLLRPILILLALLFLLEAWLWTRLEPLVAWCVACDSR